MLGSDTEAVMSTYGIFMHPYTGPLFLLCFGLSVSQVTRTGGVILRCQWSGLNSHTRCNAIQRHWSRFSLQYMEVNLMLSIRKVSEPNLSEITFLRRYQPLTRVTLKIYFHHLGVPLS